jgi:predicted nicotinamide N-methyase
METQYRGPTTTSVIRAGSTSVRLVRPAEPDRMLDDGQVHRLNRQDDYMPSWAYLWPGAFLLAEVVAKGEWSGESALEIGCGLGLAGLVGMARGLTVRFTDYDAAPLEFVARSVAENRFLPERCSTGRLDWREPPDETYSLILGADVLYERRLVPLVAGVLARMLAPGGEAWIADPYRAAAEVFPEAVAAHGLSCTVTPVEAVSDDLGPVRGTLHRVSRGADPSEPRDDSNPERDCKASRRGIVFDG